MSVAARAPTIVQLGQRTLTAVGFAMAIALSAWLWVSWQQSRNAQLQRMEVTVKLIAAHADHYFSSNGNKLAQLAIEMQGFDPGTSPGLAVPYLKAFAARETDLLGVNLIRPDGQMIYSSTGGVSGLPNLLRDPARRAEFQQLLRTTGVSIGRPLKSYFADQWVIPLRYVARDSQGRVRYALASGMPIEKQQGLWRSLEFASDAAVGLLREDGYLISRLPTSNPNEVYTRSQGGGVLAMAVQNKAGSGRYQGKMAADGKYRIGVFQRLEQFPQHYAFLSHLRQTFISSWWELVRWPLALVAGFYTAAIVVYFWLARRYGQRMREIENQLATIGSGSAGKPASSGVREIDTLVSALSQSREKLFNALQNREQLLLRAAEAGTYAVRDRDDRIVAADGAFLRMLGRPEPEVLGQVWHEIVKEERHATVPATEGVSQRVVQLPEGAGRRARWIAVAEYRETPPDGEPVRHGLAIDATDREELLSRVNLQSQRLQSLWHIATQRGKTDTEKMQLMLRLAQEVLSLDVVAVIALDVGSFSLQIGVGATGSLDGEVSPFLDEHLYRECIKERRSFYVNDLREDPAFAGHSHLAETGVSGFAGVPVWVGNQLHGVMVFLRRAKRVESFSADDRTFMELLATWFGQLLLEGRQRAELEHLAMTDVLTRLINRRAAEVRFQEEFARARRTHEVFSVAVCDLDRFKLINDHYGHDVGDEVLQHVAGIMKMALREGDWVARWGGEEFIIFMHQSEGVAAAAAMERLRRTIQEQPVETVHGPLFITASFGIGTFRGEGELAAVLSEADGCLFEAKRAGRDRVAVREASGHGTLWRAGMLQHALLDKRILPAYQSIVSLQTREIMADESLARVVELDGRVVVAGEFVEAAEGINLIHAVDREIARQSLHRCAKMRSAGKTRMHFINLSPQFLARRELVQELLQQTEVLAASCSGLAGSVVFEITERQMIENFDSLLTELQPLLDAGFRLALDDFGSGYSSFLYLATLPVSFLKIEGWMVQNLYDNPKVLGMVKSTIAFARDQGIITVAEGVEDADTASLLRELGADWAQGYYFSRPACDVGIEEFLRPGRQSVEGRS